MVSVYYAVGIVCSIFLWIFYLRCKENSINYSKVELGICYSLTRILPILMLEHHTYRSWINLLGDLIVFLMVYFCTFKKDSPSHGGACMLYIFNPIAILCMVSEGKLRMAAVFGAAAALILVSRYLSTKLENLNASELYNEYMLATVGMFGLYVATQQLKQTLAQCTGGDNQYPVLLIISISLIIVALMLTIWKLLSYKSLSNRFDSQPVAEKHAEQKPGEESFTFRNLAVILVMTVLYGGLLFFNLGSHTAPETYMRLDKSVKGGNEIILDFGREVNISKISIYLGYESKRSLSFSYLDESTNTWQVFDSKRNIQSVFCWNDVDVNRAMDKLGIVCMSDEAYIHEMVILDDKGERLLPENASYYKELFDEQEDFPANKTYYYRTMFDEVYHGRTAYEFANNLPIYEISHPPLGKSIIAIGVRLFGMTPFGWRFMCAVCGTLMVPAIYLFAWMLSKKRMIAFVTALLLCCGFMGFTLSRIATIDIIVALFIMLMFLLMYCFIDLWSKSASIIEDEMSSRKSKNLLLKEVLLLLLCGIATGCAIATKWTGVYAAVGLAVMLAAFLIPRYIKVGWSKGAARHLGILCAACIVSFIVIPCVIYVLSYIPFIQVDNSKGLIATAIENSKYMLSYHKVTVFDHPYSSQWYEWLIDKQPLLDALTILPKDNVSTIATFGSPVIAWGGLISLLHNIYMWRLKKNQQSKLLCIAYMSMLLPWLLIHRTVFIYQYFTCLLILTLMIGNSLGCIKRRRQLAIVVITESAAILFVIFYPVLSGCGVKINFVNQVLEWFQTWRFV